MLLCSLATFGCTESSKALTPADSCILKPIMMMLMIMQFLWIRQVMMWNAQQTLNYTADALCTFSPSCSMCETLKTLGSFWVS